jgi:hypothetical protein
MIKIIDNHALPHSIVAKIAAVNAEDSAYAADELVELAEEILQHIATKKKQQSKDQNSRITVDAIGFSVFTSEKRDTMQNGDRNSENLTFNI